MTELTDRYVWATVRSLPEKQRADIERELRASIADAIEARDVAADPVAAEREVLLEMGDPARLAAEYAERPSFLIGPGYFFDYLRLLKLLLAIVPAVAFGGILIGHTIDGTSWGEALLAAFATTLSVAVHLVFWVTVVFVILERTTTKSYAETMGLEWTLDSLPELPSGSRVGLVETLFSIAFLLLFAGIIVWQQFNSIVTDAAGNPVPVINPELWSFWLPYFLVVIGLEVAFAIVLHRLGRWTWGMTAANVALNVAFTAPALWLLLSGQLFNPAYLPELLKLEAVDANLASALETGASVVIPVIVVAALVISVWDIVDGFLKARRARAARA